MNARLLLFLLGPLTALSGLPSSGLAAERENKSVIPGEIPSDAYRPIWTRSPFSAVASSPDGGDSNGWTLSGLLRDGDRPVVFLVNRQTQERLTVTDKPNSKGFSVDSVDSRPNLLQSSVRIKTPGESFVVKFDSNVMTSGPAPAGGSPPPFISGNLPTPLPAPLPGNPASPSNPSSTPPLVQRIIVPPTPIPNPLPPPAK